MRPLIIFPAIVLPALIMITGCDGTGSSGTEIQTFTLLPWLEEDKANMASLSISAPASWSMIKDGKDSVSFRPSDLHENASTGDLAVYLFNCREPAKGEKACIDHWAEQQFRGTSPAEMKWEELPGNRWWVMSGAGKDGKGVAGRLYLVGGEKMASVTFRLMGETLKYLDAYKKAGNTLVFDYAKESLK